MTTKLYDVRTERFGVIQVSRDSIAEARTWARQALGVRNPRDVSRYARAIHCDSCDSAPCTCEVLP